MFAAGNGGDIDDCNCDGYSNSIYTIAVTALSGNGTKPWYTESCTAIMATTYSGAGTDSQNIVRFVFNCGRVFSIIHLTVQCDRQLPIRCPGVPTNIPVLQLPHHSLQE